MTRVSRWIIILLATTCIALTTLFLPLQVAHAVKFQPGGLLGFGGRQIIYTFCFDGIWGTAVLPGDPGGDLFWVYGFSAMKSMGPIGDQVLGQALPELFPCWVQCGWSPCIIGWGYTVLPNAGSSP